MKRTVARASAAGTEQTAANKAFLYLGYLKSGLKRFFVDDRQLWLSFLIPCFIMLAAYFVFGVNPFGFDPFGKRSVLSLDLNGQYVYYYDHMYDVFAGKESVFYSWNRNLSGEFMGIIGYYLNSPFNFLVWMFPREMIVDGLLVMMVTKIGAIGLCSAVYFSKGKKLSRVTTIIFSTSYALCAYALEQTMNPMWLDGVMILPIVIYGIEKLIDEGKFIMLTVSLVYAFVTCFYIGFMIGIFSALYFFCYAVASHKEKLYRLFIGRGFLFTAVAITSVMISAYMLLPVYNSLSYGKFDFSDNVTQATEITTNFDLIEIFDKLFPATYDTCRMSGLPFIYCGTIVLLLLPCWFFSGRVRNRDKIAYASLMIVLAVSMYIKQADMVWHGGQLPNWLPYRYSFMLSFIMLSLAAQAFDFAKDISGKRLAGIALVWFVVLLYIEKSDNYLEDIKRDTMEGLSVVLPAMLVLFIVCAAVIQLRKRLDKKWACVLLIAIIGLEGAYNTTAQLFRQHADIVYSTKESYDNVIQPTRAVVDEIREKDDGFYRIEKTYFRTVNDPMACNMYGLSHSSSVLNAKPIELLSRLGFTSRSHYTRYSGATEITKSLFGVKYELSCPDNSTAKLKSRDDISVTLNSNAMPMAYMVNRLTEDVELSATEPLQNQNELLAAMLGSREAGKYFTRIIEKVHLEKTNVTQGKTTDGHHMFKVVEQGKNAELVYTFDMPETSALYMFLPSKYERTVNVWLNREKFLGTYFEGDNNSIMKIGDFEQGESVTIGLTLTKNDLYFREAQFVYCDYDAINRDLGELKARNSETKVEKISPTHLKIEVNAGDREFLLTTVPVEKGWTITVDGEPLEKYKEVLDALIAVPLSEGRHTVEMRFTTAGYPEALIVTALGLVVFGGMIAIYLMRGRMIRRRSAELSAVADKPSEEEADYPEIPEGPDDLPDDLEGEVFPREADITENKDDTENKDNGKE